MTQAIHPNRGGTGRTDAPDSMEIPIGDGAGGFDYHELVAGDGIAIDTDAEAETVTIRSTGAGTGDMLKTTYDPTNVAGDAFDMANMAEAADAKVMTAAERTKLFGVEDGATADQSDAEIETAYNNQVAAASQGDAEAGTGTTVLRWTPQRIAQAIAALQTGVIQNNFVATTNPTTTDDTNAGYSIGSVWINTTADEAYRCVDNTASAAVWVKTSLTADELATVAITGSYNDLGDKPTIPDDAETDINTASADTLTDTSVVPFLKAGTLVKVTWANFKATLKTYFDTLYYGSGDDVTLGEVNYDIADGTVSALGNLGATETVDWATATHFTGTLDSNVTITHSNEVSGRKITLYLAYDGSAQRTITWSGVDEWLDNSSGAAPTTPSASGDVLVVTLQYVGTTCYASATGNYAVYS